jgi:hypothetical protein
MVEPLVSSAPPSKTPPRRGRRPKANGSGAEVIVPSVARLTEEAAKLESGSILVAAPAPEATPSQEAVPLSAVLMSALAPGAVNFDEAAAAAGPARYTSLQRRRPKGDEVFRILPRDYGETILYMLTLSREAKGKGEHDSYIVTPSVKAGVVSQPHIIKRIHRCAVCVAVNVFGAHFIIEIDMDSTHFAAQSCRAWAKLALNEWINVYWDEAKKQHVYTPTADQSMKVVVPAQSFNELLNLTYDESATIPDLNHPVLRRLWIAV